jgi:hypothetical protein
MSDGNRRFADAAPAILKSAIEMGDRVGDSEQRWERAHQFLAWGVPWYLSALGGVLEIHDTLAAIPGFLQQLRTAIEVQAEVDETFPAGDFLALVDEMAARFRDQMPAQAALEAPPGTGAAGAAGAAGTTGGTESGKGQAAALDTRIAEEAFNIVRAAYRVGRNQFTSEQAGEAATWMLVAGASAFLRGLELGLGSARADVLKPRFFSRLRHELREQYVEVPGYSLKHFLDIAGSIGKKWVLLSTDE